ncbi:MAG: hypothetical protein K2X38_01995 [Gemmataceae bacterium]|nr:hypothetical protein [Gemmataceae bacterium]
MLLKPYFDTEGPFGLPMKDAQARALEEMLKNVPREDAFALRRTVVARGISELQAEGRSDVSWITEQSPDRVGDVVLASGMDDSHFQLNPIVTLNHDYQQPPVGRSLWRKRVKEGSLVGVKAKTHYPARPDGWLGDWGPDQAFALVRSGLLLGKSIGFIPLALHPPTAEEIAKNASWKGVRYVVERWLLIEYACCYLPMQPNSVVEEIHKSAAISPQLPAPRSLPSESDIGASLAKLAGSKNFLQLVEKSLQRTWQKLIGIV